MKLTKEFTGLEKSAVKLTVTINKSDVKDVYNSTVAKYMKNAQIPGFRKGHVPAAVLERKYGGTLKADALSELIDKSLNEVFEKETENRPLPYRQPVIDNVPEFDAAKDLSYTVVYDVYPKVSVKEFGGITVKEPQVEVGDKELQDELKAVQERNAVVMDRKDSEAVEKGNIVTINSVELDGDGGEIADTRRQDFVFTVGSGENVYKIDDDIIGMKKNETKVVTKKYGKNEKDGDLAGQTKRISVTVTAVKTRTLPAIDDDLAQDVSEKYQTLDDMKKDILRNMNTAKDRKIAEMKSNSLLEQLVEKNGFDLPASMLEAELDGRWQMLAQQFQTSPEQLEKMVETSGQTKETMLREWTGDSEKMLKSRIIVDTLIKERNITVTPEEIEEEYKRIAEEGGITVEEVKKHYSDPRSKEYLIDDTKERKLYGELYKEVKVVKGDKMTFAELFAKK